MNRIHRAHPLLASGAAVLILLAVGCSAGPQATSTRPDPTETSTLPPSEACSPTVPNGQAPPGEPATENFLGNGSLYTILWPDGVIVFEPGGSGEIRPDGSLAMKFPFWRGDGVSGKLTIEGRSLHRPGLTSSGEIPDGYGLTGVQAAALVFPEPGCWEVTARVGNDSLTFITRVALRE